MKFSYRCPRCGEVEVEDVAQDTVQCRCGQTAKRNWSIRVDKASLKSYARWDPVVGRYVENEGQFKSALAEAQERESKKLGMDCVLATCDSRDGEALGELHGWGSDAREADLEATKRANHDQAMA
jgi:hypothetical protein